MPKLAAEYTHTVANGTERNSQRMLYCAGYLHRDLKPANLLLTEEGILKVGDLGLARLHDAQADRAANYTHTVATRWYRAPELLLGSRSYGPAADMWAVGCIFAEMLGKQPKARFDCPPCVECLRSGWDVRAVAYAGCGLPLCRAD